jgi:hypothetical protein
MAVIVVAIKVSLSALAPASFELQEIAQLGLYGQPSLSGTPWIALNRQIVIFWQSMTSGSVYSWWQTAPFNMNANLRLLAVMVRSPTIAFDLATTATLYVIAHQITSSKEIARLTSMAWLLNPYTTFSVELLGTSDVAAACLTVFACVLLLRSKPIVAALALGASVWLNLYPMLLVPPLLAYKTDMSRRSKIVLVATSLLGLLGYVQFAGQIYSTEPVRALITSSNGIRISLAAAALIVTYFAISTFAKNPTIVISQTILPVFLVFYTLSNPLPENIVWALPFLTMDVIFVKRRNIVPFVLMLLFMFAAGLLDFQGYNTPSGYSLLFIPKTVLSILKASETVNMFYPFLKAGLSATTFIYALETIRGWFRA